MFERAKKDDDTIDRKTQSVKKLTAPLRSFKSKVTGRSSDVAIIGSSIYINGICAATKTCATKAT